MCSAIRCPPTCALLIVAATAPLVWAADQPQWGQQYTRNMVSQEKGLPVWFDPGERDNQSGAINPATTKNVKWTATLGTITYGVPVVAGGRVFVGTNNGTPRDPRLGGDRGVLMCFDEKAGEFLWQLCLPKLTRVKWADWYQIGLSSSPVVEGDRLYVVSNRNEVMCLDVQGMANGNQGPLTDEGRLMAEEGQPPVAPGPKDADVLWSVDLVKELKAEPHNAANCSVLVVGDYLYVCTANGVEWTHMFVVHPEAPSVVVLDKRTGRVVARDDFKIGLDITHGQWSSIATGTVGGRPLGFFGAGNGVLYAFDMLKPGAAGDKQVLMPPVWKFHGHPLAQTQEKVPPDHQHDSTSYQVTAIPVFHKDRVYLAFTQEPFHRMKLGWLVCVDATKTGDVTRSGVVWSYDALKASVSNVAIEDGLVYAAGFDGRLHCLDAQTGRCYWVHEAGDPVSGSPLVADGKVYLGTGRQMLWVLRAGKELSVLSRIRTRDKISNTPAAANGVLYVTTHRHLYAAAEMGAKPAEEKAH
jgi:outer membrane protein assembly factor BamB